jgi:putative DNA primase/helicase
VDTKAGCSGVVAVASGFSLLMCGSYLRRLNVAISVSELALIERKHVRSRRKKLCCMRWHDNLHKFKGLKRSGEGWTAKCPAHDDQRNSLSISKGDGGRQLLYCHAGCSFEEITTALSSEHLCGKIVAEYDYKDESGTLLYQVVRYFPKDFRQRRPSGRGYEWRLNGTRRVPYHLPELLASESNAKVFIAEGEKDCDNLSKLGIIATTNVGGAGKWGGEYSEYLRGHKVVIIPDNDEPGHKHAEQVAHSLSGIAASIKIIELPGLPQKGDMSDWLDAGGTVEQLNAIVESAPEFVLDKNVEQQSSSLRVVRMSDVEPEEVEWLWCPYIPLRKLTMLDGEEGIGKSWLLCAVAGRVSRGQALPFGDEAMPGNVLLLSGSEDGLADTIRPRLDSVGADCDKVFAVSEPFTFDQSGLIKLACLIAELQPSLVIIDPLFDYVGTRTDINRDNESRAATKPLREIAARFGCAVVAVRHIGKSKGNGEARAAGLGGIGFRAAGRSGLLVGCDPQDRKKRAMVLTKSNLADISQAKAVGFTIEDGGFFWLGESNLTAKSMLARLEDQETRSAQTDATGVLRDLLREGVRPAKEVQAEMRSAGFTDDMIRRARERLRIKPQKEGGYFGSQQPRWMWQLSITEDGIQTAEDGKKDRPCHLQANYDNNNTYSNDLAEDGNSGASPHLQPEALEALPVPPDMDPTEFDAQCARIARSHGITLREAAVIILQERNALNAM